MYISRSAAGLDTGQLPFPRPNHIHQVQDSVPSIHLVPASFFKAEQSVIEGGGGGGEGVSELFVVERARIKWKKSSKIIQILGYYAGMFNVTNKQPRCMIKMLIECFDTE